MPLSGILVAAALAGLLLCGVSAQQTEIQFPVPGKVVAVVTTSELRERWASYKTTLTGASFTGLPGPNAMADDQAVFLLSTRDSSYGLKAVKCYLNRLACDTPSSQASLPLNYQAVGVTTDGQLNTTTSTTPAANSELFWCFAFPEQTPKTTLSGAVSDNPDGFALCVGKFSGSGTDLSGNPISIGFARLLQLGFSNDRTYNPNPANSRLSWLVSSASQPAEAFFPAGTITTPITGSDVPLSAAAHPKGLPVVFVGTSSGKLFQLDARIATTMGGGGVPADYNVIATELTLTYNSMSSTTYSLCSSFTYSSAIPTRPITGLAVGRPLSASTPSTLATSGNSFMITINLGQTPGPGETWLYNANQTLYDPLLNNVAAKTVNVVCATLDKSSSAGAIANNKMLLNARQRYFPQADLYLGLSPKVLSSFGALFDDVFLTSGEPQSATMVVNGFGGGPTTSGVGRTFRYSKLWTSQAVYMAPSNTYYSLDAIRHRGYSTTGDATSRVGIACGRSGDVFRTAPATSLSILRFRYQTNASTTPYSSSGFPPTITEIAPSFDDFFERKFGYLAGQTTAYSDLIFMSSCTILNSTALQASLVPVADGMTSQSRTEPYVFVTISRTNSDYAMLKPLRLSDFSDVRYGALRDPWPQYRQNVFRTARVSLSDSRPYLGGRGLVYSGIGPVASPVTTHTKDFTFATLRITKSPLVSALGFVYVFVEDTVGSSDKLYCLRDSDLTQVWYANVAFMSEAALDSLRNLVIVGISNGIAAFDALTGGASNAFTSGTAEWTYTTGQVIYAPLLIDASRLPPGDTQQADAVIFTDSNGKIYSVSRDTQALYWSLTLDQPCTPRTPPVLSPDGQYVFVSAFENAGAKKTMVYKIARCTTATGKYAWYYNPSSSVSSLASILVFSPVTSYLHFIYTSPSTTNIINVTDTAPAVVTGGTCCNVATNPAGSTSLALDVDNEWMVFPTGSNGDVMAVNLNRTQGVTYSAGSSAALFTTPTTPVIGLDGTIYTTNLNGTLYAFSSPKFNVNKPLFAHPLGAPFTTATTLGGIAIGANGVLFVPYGQFLHRITGSTNTSIVIPSPSPTPAAPSAPTPSASATTSESTTASVTASASATASISASRSATASISASASGSASRSATATVSASAGGSSSVSPGTSFSNSPTPASLSPNPVSATSSPASATASAASATGSAVSGTASASVAKPTQGTVPVSASVSPSMDGSAASTLSATASASVSSSIAVTPSTTPSSLPSPSPTLTALSKAVDQIIASIPSQSPVVTGAAAALAPGNPSTSSGGAGSPLAALLDSVVLLSRPSSTTAPFSLPSNAALLKLSFAQAFTTTTEAQVKSPAVCNGGATSGSTSAIVVPEGSTQYSSITVKLALETVTAYSSSTGTPVALVPALATAPPAWLLSVFEGIANSSAVAGKAGSIFCVGRSLGSSAMSRLVFSAPRFLKDKLIFDSSSSGSLVASFELNLTATLQLNASTATPWAESELVDCAATVSTLAAIDLKQAKGVVDSFGSTTAAVAALASSPSSTDKDPSAPYRTKHLLAYGTAAWIWNAMWSSPLAWYQAITSAGASSDVTATSNNGVAFDLLAGSGVTPSLSEVCPLSESALFNQKGSTAQPSLESCFSADERMWKPLSASSTLTRLESLESAPGLGQPVILTGKTLLFGVGSDLASSFSSMAITTSFMSPFLLPPSPFAAFSTAPDRGLGQLFVLNSTSHPSGRYFALMTPSVDEVCPLKADSSTVAGTTVASSASKKRLVMNGKPCPAFKLMLGFPSTQSTSALSADGLAKSFCTSPVSDAYAASALLKVTTAPLIAFTQANEGVVNARLRRPMTLSCPSVCTQANMDARLRGPAMTGSVNALLPTAVATAARRNLLIVPDSSSISSPASVTVAAFSALDELLSTAASTFNVGATVGGSASSSHTSASTGGFLYLRPCSPDRSAHPEAYALSQVLSDAERIRICGNATDPRSDGSFGLCAWGTHSDCQACPPGGVCRGGYSLQPRPGFFVNSEDQLDYPSPCPYPATERCVGWSPEVSSTACGLAYAGARCAVCADGWYQDSSTDGRCSRCPATNNVEQNAALAILSSVGLIVAATGGLTLLVGILAIIVSKRNGGTSYGAIIRTIAFLFSAYDALQSVVQVANTAPPDTPPFLTVVFNSLRKLQYQGISAVPLACTLAPPLLPEISIMSIALASIIVWFLAFAVWTFRLRGKNTTAFSAGTGCLARSARYLELAGKAGIILASFLFALATNAVFTVLFDSTTTSMTLSDYSFLDVDGKTASKALAPFLPSGTALGRDAQGVVMDILAGKADLYFDLASNEGAQAYQSLLDRTFDVQTLTSYPQVVRFERMHARAYPLGVITFILLVIGLPSVGYLLARFLGIPMVLERTRVPKVLLTKGLPQISYGGATTAAVMAKEKGMAEGKKIEKGNGNASSSAWSSWFSRMRDCVRGNKNGKGSSAARRGRGSEAIGLELTESDEAVANPLASPQRGGGAAARRNRVSQIATSLPRLSEADVTEKAPVPAAPVVQLELSEVTEGQLFRELTRKARQRQIRFISRGFESSAGSCSKRDCFSRGSAGLRKKNLALVASKGGSAGEHKYTSHGVGGGLGIAESPCIQTVFCGTTLSRRALASLFGAGKRFTVNPSGEYEPEEVDNKAAVSKISSPVGVNEDESKNLRAIGLSGNDRNKGKASSYLPTMVGSVPKVSVDTKAEATFRPGRVRMSFVATLSMENPLNAGTTTSSPFAGADTGRRGRQATRRGSVASKLSGVAEDQGDGIELANTEGTEGKASLPGSPPADSAMVPLMIDGQPAIVSPLRTESWKKGSNSASKNKKLGAITSNVTRSSRTIHTLLGKPVEDDDNVVSTVIEVPLFGCPGCCVRRYDRRIQTPSDLLDSSEAIKTTSLLSYFTDWAGFRASRSYASPVNWALLIFLSAASIGDSSSGYQASSGLDQAVTSLFLRGSLLFLFCASLAVWQVLDSPNELERQWMSPVLAYIFFITGISSLYSSLATARSIILDSGSSGVGGVGQYLATVNGKQSLDSLGFIVAILCASLLPLLVVVFLLTMVKGAKKEQTVQEVKQAAVRRGTQMRMAEIMQQQQQAQAATNEAVGAASPRALPALGPASVLPALELGLRSSPADNSTATGAESRECPSPVSPRLSSSGSIGAGSSRTVNGSIRGFNTGGSASGTGSSLRSPSLQQHMIESRTTAGVMMVRRTQSRKQR